MDSSGELDDDMILVIVGDEDSSGMKSLQAVTHKENVISVKKDHDHLVSVKEEPVDLLNKIKEEPENFYQLDYPNEKFVNFLKTSETYSDIEEYLEMETSPVHRGSHPKQSVKKCKNKHQSSKDSVLSNDVVISTSSPTISARRKPKPNPKYNEYMTDLAKSSIKKSKKNILEDLLESDDSFAPSSWFKSTRPKTKRKSTNKDETFADSAESPDKNNDPSSESQEDLILKGLNLKRKSVKKEKEQLKDLAETFDNNNAPPSLEVQKEQTFKGLKGKSLKEEKEQCEESVERSNKIASSSKYSTRRRLNASSDCSVTGNEKIYKNKKKKKKELLEDSTKSSDNVMNDFFEFQDLRRGFTPNPKSYVAELIKQKPKLAKDSEKLVNELCKAMKEVKPPPLPPNCFIMNDTSFVCTKCGHLSDTSPAASRHYYETHGPRYLICFACGVDFRSTTNLYKHEKRCIARDAAVVLKARARVLGAKGRSRPYLSAVRKKAPAPAKREFPCTLCSAKFSSKPWLVAHMNMHMGVRPFVCDVCGVAYASSTTLSKHKKKHSDEEYICDHCKRSFKIKSALVTHLYTHQPVRRFPCEECDSRFAARAALQLHVRRAHRGLPHPVRCALCQRRYPRTYLLRRHMLRVHGMHIMTKKMFYKHLPIMTETLVKDAKVIAKADLEDTDDEEFNREDLFITSITEDDGRNVADAVTVECETVLQENEVEKGYEIKILKDGTRGILIDLEKDKYIMYEATQDSGDGDDATDNHR